MVVTDYQHLSAEHRPVADLPDEDRIQWIRAERWINHPNAELALATMSDLLTYPQRNRMPCLLIHGRTGMGKTMILKKFHRDHPRIADPRVGLTQTPVVLMQLPPEPVEVPFYEELLGAMGLPLVGEVSRTRARRMAREALKIIGARILVIDEIHALLVGGERQQRVFLNVIRLLGLEMPLVCAGTPEGSTCSLDGQRIGRPLRVRGVATLDQRSRVPPLAGKLCRDPPASQAVRLGPREGTSRDPEAV
jgi:hypothetical protein